MMVNNDALQLWQCLMASNHITTPTSCCPVPICKPFALAWDKSGHALCFASTAKGAVQTLLAGFTTTFCSS